MNHSSGKDALSLKNPYLDMVLDGAFMGLETSKPDENERPKPKKTLQDSILLRLGLKREEQEWRQTFREELHEHLLSRVDWEGEEQKWRQTIDTFQDNDKISEIAKALWREGAMVNLAIETLKGYRISYAVHDFLDELLYFYDKDALTDAYKDHPRILEEIESRIKENGFASELHSKHPDQTIKLAIQFSNDTHKEWIDSLTAFYSKALLEALHSDAFIGAIQDGSVREALQNAIKAEKADSPVPEDALSLYGVLRGIAGIAVKNNMRSIEPYIVSHGGKDGVYKRDTTAIIDYITKNYAVADDQLLALFQEHLARHTQANDTERE